MGVLRNTGHLVNVHMSTSNSNESPPESYSSDYVTRRLKLYLLFGVVYFRIWNRGDGMMIDGLADGILICNGR